MRANGRFNAIEAPTTINADLKMKIWKKSKLRPRIDKKNGFEKREMGEKHDISWKKAQKVDF